MSATIDLRLFASNIAVNTGKIDDKNMELEEIVKRGVPVIDVPGVTFPIKVEYWQGIVH